MTAYFATSSENTTSISTVYHILAEVLRYKAEGRVFDS